MPAMTGKPAAKIAVSTKFNWCDEMINITSKFKAHVNGFNDDSTVSTFQLYVKGLLGDDWYTVENVDYIE